MKNEMKGSTEGQKEDGKKQWKEIN